MHGAAVVQSCYQLSKEPVLIVFLPVAHPLLKDMMLEEISAAMEWMRRQRACALSAAHAGQGRALLRTKGGRGYS